MCWVDSKMLPVACKSLHFLEDSGKTIKINTVGLIVFILNKAQSACVVLARYWFLAFLEEAGGAR